jgi:hypothetical protein
VWDEHDQHLVFLVVNVIAREEISDDRNFREPRPSIKNFHVCPLDESAENAGLSIFQTNIMFYHSLADDGFGDSADGLFVGD